MSPISMSRRRPTLLQGAATWACAAVGALSAPVAIAQTSPAEAARIDVLARELQQVESLRAVKRLQISYAQYSEFGLWSDMADLFSRDAIFEYGPDKVRGRAAIAQWLKSSLGAGLQGLRPGALHTQMALIPVVTLAPDGRSAKGRWHELSLLGQYGAEARWAGGIQENDYVIEGGKWKISRLHHTPLYAGSYADGWRNVAPDLAVVPYHFTPGQAGSPFPQVLAPSAADTHNLTGRIARLRDEDLIRNLQNAYGYYVDQKMWSDIVDLFAEDCSIEIAGSGIWKGPAGIRRLLGRDGPAGLRHGEVNDHLQLDTLITVAPDGQQAWSRGLDFGMLGQNNVSAYWTEAIFENHYVKQAGVWRLASVKLFPKLRSDYYQGWARSQLAEPAPIRGLQPDAPSALPAGGPAKALIPAFRFANPATGKPVRYLGKADVIGETSILDAGPVTSRAEAAPLPGDIPELERQVAMLKAYDSVENVSSASGAFLDDFAWDRTGVMFSRNGRREKYQVGFYVGPERIRQADARMYGTTRTGPRTRVQFHLRTQPVIDVAPDGKSAKLRTRLFSFNSSSDKAGEFQSGMYPNDVLVLEDGVWKFAHQAINELYYRSAGYAGGWAKVPEADPRLFAADRAPTMMDKLRASFPPDVATEDLGVRGQGFAPGPDFVEFPAVKPMWFHYANPVSGREPANYCPDESTCHQTTALFK